MTVNGAPVSGEVEGRTLLVEFLRDHLRLTGTHVGCDTSQCGACVVHVDGAGEGLHGAGAGRGGRGGRDDRGAGAGPTERSRPVQAAFREHHGLQCGFCTPGMIMSATALLRENPTPTEAEVREYLEGNICRCTGYHNIVKAILAASGQDVSGIAAE
jgi:carbon-monoxide dehydrogenase small subunit